MVPEDGIGSIFVGQLCQSVVCCRTQGTKVYNTVVLEERGVTRKPYVEKLPHVIVVCFDGWEVATITIKLSSRESVQATQQQPAHCQLCHV